MQLLCRPQGDDDSTSGSGDASPSTAPGSPHCAEPPEAPGFAELYDTYGLFVARSLRRLGVPDQALDDALQEVFIVVHRRLQSFVGETHHKTWLFRIAMHVARNQRRTARRKTLPGEEGPVQVDPDSLPANEANALERLVRGERLQLFYALLDALDEDKRTVFVLHELEEMTMPEVAKILGINLNTAYARLRTARLAFKNALEAQQGPRGGGHP